MKQNENDQNHKKESTPVVDDKPNGKSQFKCRTFLTNPGSLTTATIGKCWTFFDATKSGETEMPGPETGNPGSHEDRKPLKTPVVTKTMILKRLG